MGEDDDHGRAHDPDAPMTATWSDVLSGAGHALLLFMVLLLSAVAVTVIIGVSDTASDLVTGAVGVAQSMLWTALIGGSVALLVMLTGMPLAWLCARAMRRRRSVAFHVVVWSVFGLLVGPSVIAVFSAPTDVGFLLSTPFAPASAVVTGVCVLYGWWRASRRARRLMRPLGPVEANDSLTPPRGSHP